MRVRGLGVRGDGTDDHGPLATPSARVVGSHEQRVIKALAGIGPKACKCAYGGAKAAERLVLKGLCLTIGVEHHLRVGSEPLARNLTIDR